MGFGSFGLGTSSFGADPVYVPSPAAAETYPRAVLYDPRVRQFVLVDQFGNNTDVHPVDQIVAIRLTSFEGQSASAPDLGTRLRNLSQGLTQDKAQTVAYQEVTRVLLDLLNAGDVVLVSVIADLSFYGRASYAVTYVNTRDPNNSTRYPTTVAIGQPIGS